MADPIGIDMLPLINDTFHDCAWRYKINNIRLFMMTRYPLHRETPVQWKV
jgi:hypothetical protein